MIMWFRGGWRRSGKRRGAEGGQRRRLGKAEGSRKPISRRGKGWGSPGRELAGLPWEQGWELAAGTGCALNAGTGAGIGARWALSAGNTARREGTANCSLHNALRPHRACAATACKACPPRSRPAPGGDTASEEAAGAAGPGRAEPRGGRCRGRQVRRRGAGARPGTRRGRFVGGWLPPPSRRENGWWRRGEAGPCPSWSAATPRRGGGQAREGSRSGAGAAAASAQSGPVRQPAVRVSGACSCRQLLDYNSGNLPRGQRRCGFKACWGRRRCNYILLTAFLDGCVPWDTIPLAPRHLSSAWKA